jgi:sugar phosphate isomerase/epimerase
MKPKICCNVIQIKEFSFEDYPFEGYELKMRGGMKPNIITLLKIKDDFKGKDLSLHSQLGRIFSCVERGFPEFSEAEMNILKSEIIISKLIGIKQIIFHMKESPLTKEEIKRFNEIILFAEKNGIEMVYENHICSENVILDVLEKLPKVKFCLDIGHLNIAMKKGYFNMDIKEFLDRVSSKLVNIHAHNNYGEEDEHNSIEDGNLDWKDLLNKLKGSNLKKIVIENDDKDDVIKSKKALEKFYKIK